MCGLRSGTTLEDGIYSLKTKQKLLIPRIQEVVQWLRNSFLQIYLSSAANGFKPCSVSICERAVTMTGVTIASATHPWSVGQTF